jgi:hypothetical protein
MVSFGIKLVESTMTKKVMKSKEKQLGLFQTSFTKDTILPTRSRHPAWSALKQMATRPFLTSVPSLSKTELQRSPLFAKKLWTISSTLSYRVKM